MANIPLWRGSTQLQQEPISPKFENNKEGFKYVVSLTGPYASCVANQPPRLANIQGVPNAYFVDVVEIERSRGGKGRLVITMITNPEPGLGTTVSEIEWIEVQKKLESHPMFNATSTYSTHPNAGKYVLNDQDLDAIEEWKNATTATARSAAYAALTTNSGVSGNAPHLVDRLKLGQDSYVVYSPHARQTTKNAAQPSTTYCGYISDPPSEVKAPGYSYLQTGDHGTRDWNWTRTIEWTGADFIDSELYPTAP